MKAKHLKIVAATLILMAITYVSGGVICPDPTAHKAHWTYEPWGVAATVTPKTTYKGQSMPVTAKDRRIVHCRYGGCSGNNNWYERNGEQSKTLKTDEEETYDSWSYTGPKSGSTKNWGLTYDANVPEFGE